MDRQFLTWPQRITSQRVRVIVSHIDNTSLISNDPPTAAIAHPAFLDEMHFKNVKRAFGKSFFQLILMRTLHTEPLFLSCAETDHTFPLSSRRTAEDILISKKSRYTIQVFSGVVHGFATKGDPEIEDCRQ